MKKILVPTDFSATAGDALRFALEIGLHTGAEVRVVHIYRFPDLDSTMPKELATALVDENPTEAMRIFREYTEKAGGMEGGVPLTQKVKVFHVLEEGFAIDDLVKDSVEADMIVMGTKGAGSIAEKMIGTITSAVIARAKCPVLGIPSGVKYQKIKHIAYASDFDPKDGDFLTQLVNFAKAFDAKVTCVNIISKENGEFETEETEKSFDMSSLPVTFTMVRHPNIHTALETYVETHDVDVLAMLTHKRSVWDSIFHKSETRRMAYSSPVPLLAFHA